MSIRVIQVGLGPIGQGTVRRLLQHPGMRLVGAVDPAPDKAGKNLAALLAQNGAPLGGDALKQAEAIAVAPSLAQALQSAQQRPQVATHTTSSFLNAVTPQLVELAQAGLNVVSTTEELSYPWRHHPAEAEQIDEAAKQAGVTVLGTGVNPGFVMDLLPVCLSGVSATVESVQVDRVVDAGKRRGPLKKKVGAGITVEEFERRAATGTFGHIGLVESVAMLAAAFGWELVRIDSQLRPKIAQSPYESADVHVPVGNVLGIDQVATGVDAAGRERIRLHLQMYVGAPNPHDTIRIAGEPPLEMTVVGGTPGDIATAATVVNWVPAVLTAAPGLKTVIDLPVPRWSGAAR